MSRYCNFIQTLKIILYIIRKARLFIVVLFVSTGNLSTYAQHKLANQIELPKYENATIREIFDALHQKHSVLFSYNSNLLDLDQQVNAAPYQGLLIDYLEKLLGEKYSFKETFSHIIITYAPQRMDVSTIDMDTIRNNRARISGYVKDVRTSKPVRMVTVYDHTYFQASTLTGKNGYFELDIRNPDNTVSIALSKENYRDTMLVLLLPVEVSHFANGRRTGYYHTTDSSKTISNSAIGRFFTSSQQRIQNMNLGGFFVQSPFQVSLTPGLGTHGLFNSQVVNKFSLNLVGGYTAGVQGTELAGGFNINQFDMNGFQMAGLFNVVGGNTKGIQLAGVSNVGLNKFAGMQMAGVWNSVDKALAGIQMAGVGNFANDAGRNIQFAGALNISRSEVWTQLAGGGNIVEKVQGIQFAGGFNIAKEVGWVQLAGAINIAKQVRGVQFGVVNIADSSDFPIGVFNWIKNGSRQLSLGIDESRFAYLNFKSGGRVLYSILGIGTYIDKENLQYGVETGFGGRIVRRPRFTLSGELVQRIQFDENWKYNEANRTSFRVVPSLHLGRHLQVYAAASLTYSETVHPDVETKGVVWNLWGTDATRNTFHGGGTVGLTYVF